MIVYADFGVFYESACRPEKLVRTRSVERVPYLYYTYIHGGIRALGSSEQHFVCAFCCFVCFEFWGVHTRAASFILHKTRREHGDCGCTRVDLVRTKACTFLRSHSCSGRFALPLNAAPSFTHLMNVATQKKMRHIYSTHHQIQVMCARVGCKHFCALCVAVAYYYSLAVAGKRFQHTYTRTHTDVTVLERDARGAGKHIHMYARFARHSNTIARRQSRDTSVFLLKLFFSSSLRHVRTIENPHHTQQYTAHSQQYAYILARRYIRIVCWCISCRI